MKASEFVAKAKTHYEAKLKEERERFDVLAISDRWIENNAGRIVDDGGGLWSDISKESGLCLVVDYADDPQVVFAMLSKCKVPRPLQLYKLWWVVGELSDLDECDDHPVELLKCYDGPYKLKVPKGLVDDYPDE